MHFFLAPCYVPPFVRLSLSIPCYRLGSPYSWMQCANSEQARRAAMFIRSKTTMAHSACDRKVRMQPCDLLSACVVMAPVF